MTGQYDTPQKFDTVDVLQVLIERQADASQGEFMNLVPNPNGELGSWGWTALDDNEITLLSTTQVNGVTGIKSEATGPRISSVWSTTILTSPGLWAAGCVTILDTNTTGFAEISYYDADYNAIGSVTSYNFSSAGTINLAPVEAPADSVYLRLVIANGDASNGDYFVFNQAMLAMAEDEASLAGLVYNDVHYSDITGSFTSVDITRTMLDTSTATVTLADDSIDPATSQTFVPGLNIIISASVPGATGEPSWTPIFTGFLTDWSVSYEPFNPVGKRSISTITCSDNLTTLANTPCPTIVAAVRELPAILRGNTVPWNIVGNTGGVLNPTYYAKGDSGTLLDQIVKARDTHLGMAWIDRFGVLYVYDYDTIPSGTLVIPDTAYNANLTRGYDTDNIVNSVNVATTGNNSTWGPYQNIESIRVWGVHSATYTVVTKGSVDPVTILIDSTPYPAKILLANSLPVPTVQSITIPFPTAHAVAEWCAVDLGMLAHVTAATPALDEAVRITGVQHSISPDTWTMTLTLTREGLAQLPTSSV